MTLQICWIFSSFFLIDFLDLSLPRRRVIAGHAAPTRLGPKKREWYAAFASFRGFFGFCFKSLTLEGDVISWPQLPKGLKISFKSPPSIWKQSTYFSVSLYGLGEWPFTRMALIGRVKRWTPEVSKYTVYSYTSNVFYSNSELGNHKGRQ